MARTDANPPMPDFATDYVLQEVDPAFLAGDGSGTLTGAQIPVDKYLIPVFVYAPAHIAPRRVDRLMSQIDIPPTLLGLADRPTDPPADAAPDQASEPVRSAGEGDLVLVTREEISARLAELGDEPRQQAGPRGGRR